MKRARANSAMDSSKKQHLNPPRKVSTPQAAARVDADPPLPKLIEAVEKGVKDAKKGDSVVYWMRMCDLRVSDNHALSLASAEAHSQKIPLVVLFIFTPADYAAHDRGARKIDFTIRNLRCVKEKLAELDISLHTITSSHLSRSMNPHPVLKFLEKVNSTSLYANIEYEVDELRRDIGVCKIAKEKGIKATFVHDKCIVQPGVVATKDGRAYAVYSPYQRNWLGKLQADQKKYLEKYPDPKPNDRSKKMVGLEASDIPDKIEGFELDEKDKETMERVWPAGETVAGEMLEKFLHTKSNPDRLGAVAPVDKNALSNDKASRVAKYGKERDDATRDTTSRLSPYLSSGVISSRECVRGTLSVQKSDKVDGGRDTGIGRWVQELAWRDFYANILVSFPRVSMGRPYLEKYAEIAWEAHQDGESVYGADDANPIGTGKDNEALEKWKAGKTGVPIVDAGMRCIKEMGWAHNRLRMIVAMFLVKDLMFDWRVGERYFAEQLIDGDLASNNGGWQWSASTGVDPCPYFRIFNPYSQSTKVDPSGEFIRHWVPELAGLKGQDVYKPPPAVADKLGYPRAMVDHAEARDRALRRFKNPGEK